MDTVKSTAPVVTVAELHRFQGSDMHDLCEATELAIQEGGGFGWVEVPGREVLERYWRGVLAVPGRSLVVGRLDGVIAGSAQLVRPPPNNEAQRFAAAISTSFVVPWARGHGMARKLLELVENIARAEKFETVTFDCRETQTAAIQLCHALGYVHWGTNPVYARVNARLVPGCFFYKLLGGPADPSEADGAPR